MSLNLKCYVRIKENWRTSIKAILIAFVPAEKRQRPIAEGVLDTITTDAIVRLLTFDADKLYQVPLELVGVVDEWRSKDLE
jgi:hypothetical protein